MDHDLSKMKVSELREALKLKGLNTTGNKQELIDRLQAASSEEGTIDPNIEDELLNDDDLESEEKALLDTTSDILKSPDSSKSSTPEIIPPKKVSLKRNVVIEMPVFEEKKTEDNQEDGSEPDKKVVKISELSAKDRLEMRAKKFGGNSAAVESLPSQTKLDARAIRFGISSSNTTSSETSANSSDLLKKRAERFGAISDTAKKSEYDEKLMKRKERFEGGEGKIVISADSPKVDYDEKARLRLERFKQTA